MHGNTSDENWKERLLRGWVRDIPLAFGFLTRLRLPARQVPEDEFARAARAYPLVGAWVGLMGAAVLAAAAWLGLPPLACALAALAAMVLLTGGLHEDGLADVADGFGGGSNPDERLTIMRDSRTGAFGVLALVLALGLKAALLAGMAGVVPAALALIAAAALSRAAMPLLMAWLAPARHDGLARNAGAPRPVDVMAGLALGAAAAFLCLPWAHALVAVGLVLLVAVTMGFMAIDRIGGKTGDVLGAAQQVSEVAILAVAAAGPFGLA
ncbi:MAG: adenosylcobinamide-GDP ribazoletransferase [Hyphomicrobiales bacterium]|nr:adenosylcobinamide-GDP ribazoletransferase [Hyphomicrobiales bacterium]MCP5370109.1 adenosylcobinamide-GDP ribazoletransferase [Hyphomicrobiales bacterium]